MMNRVKLSLFKLFVLLIVSLILLVAVMALINVRESEVNQQFQLLQGSIYDLVFSDEAIARSCDEVSIAAKNENVLHVNLRGSLENYVKSAYAMGRLISHKTFLLLYQFDKANNALQSLPAQSICKQVKTIKSLVSGKHKLLSVVNQDQLNQSSLSQVVISLFDRPETKKYLIESGVQEND